MVLQWRTMSERDRERAYNPSSCLADGDYQPFVAAYRRRSDEAWARAEADLAASTVLLRCGAKPSHSIDVALPASSGSDRPLLVFIHGGYWQELSKLDSRFPADACLERGWAFAAVDYTLAPDASLGEIVDECRQAVRQLLEHAAELGFDPDRVIVAGSSAGAHLAVMVALEVAVASVVAVSGVFDLEPLVGLSINDALGLDAASARRQSPLLFDVTGFPPTILATGDNETAEFKAQTKAFGRHLSSAGVWNRSIEVEGRNHFDVILDLAEKGTSLGDAVAELIDE